MRIEELLLLTIKRQASDLHIIPDYPPTIRVNGNLIVLRNYPIIDKDLSQQLAFSILTAEQKETFLLNKELDFSYQFNEFRFRTNLYFTKGKIALAFRLIPSIIKTIEELNLPPILHQFSDLEQGFILITGPTGEGKSTTLAAIINEINLKYAKHIITVEDPIEFVYPTGKSIISQREIGQDTNSWRLALKAILREDPDVVLIGEMRDYESIQSALTIAETGHLVFSTLHTNSASQTLDRIIDIFPPHQQQQIRIQLSTVLKAIVCQKLLPKKDGSGRIVACEILLNNPAVASVIREGKTHLIDNILLTSSSEGMMLFERYLFELYLHGLITKETAFSYAIRPKELEKLIG